MELYSDLQRLATEQRRRQREKQDSRQLGKERLEQLRAEQAEWLERGELLRVECVAVEEELEREETRQRQLQRAMEGKVVSTNRMQRVSR